MSPSRMPTGSNGLSSGVGRCFGRDRRQSGDAGRRRPGRIEGGRSAGQSGALRLGIGLQVGQLRGLCAAPGFFGGAGVGPYPASPALPSGESPAAASARGGDAGVRPPSPSLSAERRGEAARRVLPMRRRRQETHGDGEGRPCWLPDAAGRWGTQRQGPSGRAGVSGCARRLPERYAAMVNVDLTMAARRPPGGAIARAR